MRQPLIRLLLVHPDPTAADRFRHEWSDEGVAVTVCSDTTVAAEQLAGPSPWDLLMLDGSLGEADRVWGLEIGADDVLPSPFGLAECLARIRALVRRHQLGLESTTELRCGAVTLNVEEHRVRRDDLEVSLTPREFRLLQFFLEHPCRIWSRDELLARVWGETEACELDPKTVDVHIRWLRLKLEANPSQPTLITTVRGQGYRCG